MNFNNLGLIPLILKAVNKKGYEEPSPIQEKAIPLILKRKDVLASAQTGTGKTAGFTLPLLQILAKNSNSNHKKIRALILTPTRELAAQIYENVVEYSTYLSLKSTVIFGGVNQKPQVSKIRGGVDILIATPGRLLDLENQRLLSLRNIEILVLDEADRMLDMGFQRDINKIMQLLPAKRQNLLFSATFSKEIKKLAKGILNNPALIETSPENTTVEAIIQYVYKVDKSNKSRLIIQLIKEGNWNQVLVFTRTKHGANKLCKKMINENISAAAIHGNKSQGARTKALAGFKEGIIKILVATDIAARGLDIPLLPHVVNFELPNIPEDYVHRIGRTGRAGAKGEAISLVCIDEKQYLKDIEKIINLKIPSKIKVGFEPDLNAVPELPKQKNRNNFNKKKGRFNQNKKRK
tara:strand:+ start:22 stop:1245 length:1224 start_codon:yes stop_codon:yes gene_type:complete